jgi:hypothetical protein
VSVSPDLSAKAEEPHWPDIRAWLQAHPRTLLDDRSLLEEIGLKPHGRNVIEFGRAALTKLEEAAEREADASRPWPAPISPPRPRLTSQRWT